MGKGRLMSAHIIGNAIEMEMASVTHVYIGVDSNVLFVKSHVRNSSDLRPVPSCKQISYSCCCMNLWKWHGRTNGLRHCGTLDATR